MNIPVLELFQGADARLQARLVKSDQSVVTVAEVDSFTVKIYEGRQFRKNLSDVDVDDHFFDTLQVGNGWSRDATGYNFEYVVAGDDFVNEGGVTYRVEVDVLTDTEKVRAAWYLKYLPWAGIR